MKVKTMENDFNTKLADLFKILAEVKDNGELAEYVLPIEPEVMAQLLMCTLPMAGTVNPDMVRYWHKVVEYMGPDYLAGYRAMGHLMKELDGFVVR